MNSAIYVISLESSLERRQAFRRQTAGYADVSWDFFPAHTALAGGLTYDERDAWVAKGRPLDPKELAVYSSHYAVWQKIVTEGLDQAVILEDDVVADWPLLARLLELDHAASGLHFLKLYNLNVTRFVKIQENFLSRALMDCRGYNLGAQAYLLTRAGAERFLTAFKRVRLPVDDEMDRSWGHGMPNLALYPYPVFERYGPSTIGMQRYAGAPFPHELRVPRSLHRVGERIRRAAQKVTRLGLRSRLDVNRHQYK